MGKRKKQSELDAILEQLKISYGADVDSDLEDSLLESEDTEKDDELNSVLERIFMDNDLEEYNNTVSETEEKSAADVEPSSEAEKESAYVEKVTDGEEESVQVDEEVADDDYEQIGIDFVDNTEETADDTSFADIDEVENTDETEYADEANDVDEMIIEDEAHLIDCLHDQETQFSEEQQVDDILSKMLSVDGEKETRGSSAFTSLAAVLADTPLALSDELDDPVYDISASVGFSPSYLRALFAERVGESPMHYLNRIRIEHAKEMLSSRVFTLGEIASACGFQNEYYFNSVFKKITGVPPGKY